jgi:hypothetical protein
LLEGDQEASALFDIALEQCGYSPAHEPDYATLLLRVVEEGFFEVRENFPRLRGDSFMNGIPPGIERIEYEINLNGFQHLCVAQRPDQMLAWYQQT